MVHRHVDGSWTVVALKAECKSRGMVGYSRLLKAGLIRALNAGGGGSEAEAGAGSGRPKEREPPAWDYSSRTPSDQSESPPRPSRSFGTPISNPNRETAGHNGAAFPSARKGTPARGRSPGQEGSETSRRRQDVMDKKKSADQAYASQSYELAHELYSEAIDMADHEDAETKARLFANRAAALMNIGRSAYAMSDCEKALRLKPDYPKVVLRKARLHARLKEWDLAIEGFEDCLDDVAASPKMRQEASVELEECRERQAEEEEQTRKAREAQRKEKEKRRRSAEQSEQEAKRERKRRKKAKEQAWRRQADEVRRKAAERAYEAEKTRKRAEAQAWRRKVEEKRRRAEAQEKERRRQVEEKRRKAQAAERAYEAEKARWRERERERRRKRTHHEQHRRRAEDYYDRGREGRRGDRGHDDRDSQGYHKRPRRQDDDHYDDGHERNSGGRRHGDCDGQVYRKRQRRQDDDYYDDERERNRAGHGHGDCDSEGDAGDAGATESEDSSTSESEDSSTSESEDGSDEDEKGWSSASGSRSPGSESSSSRSRSPFEPATPTVFSSGHYATLGITSAASMAEVKKAYFKLALQHHPDKNNGSAASTERFKVISAAFEVLRDENERADYDADLSRC